MSNERAVSSTQDCGPSRRRWLVGCGLTLAAAAVQAQSPAPAAPSASTPAPAAPRLRFKSRRAVCDCAGETDEDAIERALADRSERADATRGAAAASASVAGAAPARPAETHKSPTTTPRRQAP